MPYALAAHDFSTPAGLPAKMSYRLDSSDWNTIYSCMNEDEYGFRYRKVAGVAVDIGAHIGGVTIGLALDNPELRVLAVEAVPDNAALLRENVARNGVQDRVTVLECAAGGTDPVEVWYGYSGSESAEHHAFIGNSSLAYDTGEGNHQTVTYPVPVTVASLVAGAGPITLCKIDCEGGEYAFLADPAIDQIATILGEWHPVRKKTQADIRALLEATHDVTFSGPEAGPGGFVAVRR